LNFSFTRRTVAYEPDRINRRYRAIAHREDQRLRLARPHPGDGLQLKSTPATPTFTKKTIHKLGCLT
jgi:hypothetical protein